MKNRFLAVVSALSAVALVSGILVVTANAHIGASHTPFTTEGPDLRSVTIDGDDVDFCFDEEVSEISGDEFDFWIAGYDTDSWTDGDDVDLDSDADECVIATFDDDRALEDFTVAGVYEDAVQDRQDNENIEASVALEGSTNADGEGDTEAPDLVDFDENEADDQITYIFDEDLEDGPCPTDAGNFGYYTNEGENGGRNDGTAIDECDGEEVTVDFGNVDNVSFVFFDPDNEGASGDVCAADPTPAEACTGYQSTDGSSNDADLTDVERTDDDEWTFHFDEDVENPDFNDFFLYMEDGTAFTADAGTCDEDEGSSVKCDFSDLEDATDEEVVRGGVNECAADTDDTAGDCTTVGGVPIGNGGNATEGVTNGPDLESCDPDAANELVTFNFDESIAEASADADDFSLFDEDGNQSDGSDIDDSEEEAGQITIEFDEDEINDAVGCHVYEYEFTDLVNDAQGNDNDNVLASVGIAAPSSAPPSTSTATTTTTSTTVTDGPDTINAPTSVTIAYKKAKKKFAGKVGNRFAQCQANRLMKLKRNGKVVGQTTSKANGSWSIKKKGRKARGRFQATAARKVFTRGNGDTVVCGKGVSRTLRRRNRR